MCLGVVCAEDVVCVCAEDVVCVCALVCLGGCIVCVFGCVYCVSVCVLYDVCEFVCLRFGTRKKIWPIG